MIRLVVPLGVFIAGFYIYSIVDCALSDRMRVRALPKAAWVAIVVVFPLIGGTLWFIFGRPRKAGSRLGRSYAPDDDPDFLKNLAGSRATDARIRQIEKELEDLDDTAQKKKGDTDTPDRRDA